MEHRTLKTETGSANKITVMDEKGSGGACHRYMVAKDRVSLCFVGFREGPVSELGGNGVTERDLLAIIKLPFLKGKSVFPSDLVPSGKIMIDFPSLAYCDAFNNKCKACLGFSLFIIKYPALVTRNFISGKLVSSSFKIKTTSDLITAKSRKTS